MNTKDITGRNSERCAFFYKLLCLPNMRSRYPLNSNVISLESTSKCPSYVFEFIQTRLQNLLTLLEGLTFAMEDIDCTGCNKHIHEFFIIHRKKIQCKCHNQPLSAILCKEKKFILEQKSNICQN